jgi:hypothetical protein
LAAFWSLLSTPSATNCRCHPTTQMEAGQLRMLPIWHRVSRCINVGTHIPDCVQNVVQSAHGHHLYMCFNCRAIKSFGLAIPVALPPLKPHGPPCHLIVATEQGNVHHDVVIQISCTPIVFFVCVHAPHRHGSDACEASIGKGVKKSLTGSGTTCPVICPYLSS